MALHKDEGSFYGDDISYTLSTSTTDTYTHLEIDGDKEPDIGDFVLAKLFAEKYANSYHYVAEVIDKDDPEFVVSIFSAKLVKPATYDIANIHRDGVVMCLPAHNASGGTKRAQSILTFSVDQTGFNFQ